MHNALMVNVLSNPVVSVVMGVFNGADLISDTIESVLTQSLDEHEFIIVNDGSTDEATAKVLSSYANHDKRVRVISKANEGLTRALIDGCSAAVGRYIARIDVGDVMLPFRLEKQALVMNTYPDCHLVTSKVSLHAPDWEFLDVDEGAPSADRPCRIVLDELDQRLTGDVPHHGSVMFRRSAYVEVGGYRSEFYFGQDWDLWYRLAEVGLFYVVPEVLYKARYFPNALSMTNSKRQDRIALCSLEAHRLRKQGLSDARALHEASEIHPGNMLEKKSSERPEQGNYFIGERLRRAGDKRCRKYFFAAVRSKPYSARSWIRLLQSIRMY